MNAQLVLIFGAIERLLSFYDHYGQEVNPDGLFGLRIFEGQFLIYSEQISDPFIRNKLIQISKRAGSLADDLIDPVRSHDPGYYDQVRFLIEHSWNATGPRRSVNESLIWDRSIRPKSRFDEEASDICFKALTDQNCSISKDCYNRVLMDTHTSGYRLLHQILYISLARSLECWAMNPLLGQDLLYTTEARLCANAWPETLEDFKDDLTNISDVSMERMFVCGAIGFTQFAIPQLLTPLLSLQRKEGCFAHSGGKKGPENEEEGFARSLRRPGSNLEDQKSVENPVRKSAAPEEDPYENKPPTRSLGSPRTNLEDQKSVKNPVRKSADPEEDPYETKPPGRKLLMESGIPSTSCLSHLTAVAAGALTAYVRALLNI